MRTNNLKVFKKTKDPYKSAINFSQEILVSQMM